ncbi:MAG: MATE family efflux transporter, partial [Hyphomicrobiales bacterium]
GFATYSTILNWAKATVGTVPFVWVGASMAGAHGVIAGWGLGAVAFGILAIVSCLRVVNKLDGTPPKGDLPPPLWRAALSAFSSGKGANLQ